MKVLKHWLKGSQDQSPYMRDLVPGEAYLEEVGGGVVVEEGEGVIVDGGEQIVVQVQLLQLVQRYRKQKISEKFVVRSGN